MSAAAPLIPAELSAYADRGPAWADWLARLPVLTAGLLHEWRLQVDGPSMSGHCALVVPVRTDADAPAVLKVGWPHWEADHEHLALRFWNGNGAVQLIRADPHRSALLLERLEFADLSTVGVLDACEVVAGLYRRLHRPATAEFRTLSSLCEDWKHRLAALPTGSGLPPRYVDQATSLASSFAVDPATDGRIVHTDLHYFNVLRGRREPWLAIDPKPLSGDPAFEIAPLLWNRLDEAAAAGRVRDEIRARFFTVVDAAGFDEERAKAWVVLRMIVNAMWEIEDPSPDASETADWITTCVTIAKAMTD
jgi:streptomycin 6-kinase